MVRRFALVLLMLGLVVAVVVACGENETDIDTNRAPEVSLRGDFTARLGHLVPVVASASDPDGDALDYRWDLLSAPAGAAPTLDASGGHIFVLSTDMAGEYELRVEVDDGQAVAADVVVITFDPDFELDPWAAMSASPYVIPEVVSVQLPDPDTGDLISTEVAVLAGYVVQGGDLVLGRLDEDGGISPSSFVRESAAFPSSVIPYEFVMADFPALDRNWVKAALNALAAETVLTFEDVTGQGSTALRIRFERNGMYGLLPGCWAEKNFLVQPGVRVVNLGSAPGDCMSERTIKHEVLHALGFYHEHQRRDRDDHVNVMMTDLLNVDAYGSYVLNYAWPLDGKAGGSYDWLSIMHYPFGLDGYGILLQPNDGALPDGIGFDDVGWLAQLSDGDIEAIRRLYGSHTDPDPTVRDYTVGPGRVATVTSIEGVIEDYDGGPVDATFTGIFAMITGCPVDDPACQPRFTPGRPWVPTSIDALGRFTVALPASPSLDDGGFMLCGGERMFSVSGALYVHDAPFGEPGSSPTSSYSRFRLEDPKEPVGFLADAAAVVLYAYTTSSVDITCIEPSDDGLGSLVFDVDVRLRPGWNVMTWLQRSEGDNMVLYMRTGEPDLKVPWGVPEQLY